MQQEEARIIAYQALEWLVGDQELCEVFLGSTGGSISEIKNNAQDEIFLASVLEFITMDDKWVIRFCDSAGLNYDKPLQARYALPGAENVQWT